ncbi:unnamed protein product, partial [Caenorhabditis auriculariae]
MSSKAPRSEPFDASPYTMITSKPKTLVSTAELTAPNPHRSEEFPSKHNKPTMVLSVEERTDQSPGYAFHSDYSRRVKYTRIRSKQVEPVDPVVEDTVRGERHFLNKIERCKNKRLQRICVCPLNGSVLIKEKMLGVQEFVRKTKQVCWITCCPPVACFLSRVAFWPPRCEYFFFHQPSDVQAIDKVEYEEEAIAMASRKKKLQKIKKANKHSMGKTWSIGMAHPCAEDVKDVEGFILKTKRRTV